MILNNTDEDNTLYEVDEALVAKNRRLRRASGDEDDDDKLVKIDKSKLENNTYDFNYKIVLNYSGEEGYIEDYINELNGEDKRKDNNDMFNFGLNPEKWIKLLNKSILMHYEKHILEKVDQKNNETKRKD